MGGEMQFLRLHKLRLALPFPLEQGGAGTARFCAVRPPGHHAEAEKDVLSAELVDHPYGTYNLACFWALAGEAESAIRSLRRSLALGFADLVIIDEEDLQSLRGNPDYEAIVAEVRRRAEVTE